MMVNGRIDERNIESISDMPENIPEFAPGCRSDVGREAGFTGARHVDRSERRSEWCLGSCHRLARIEKEIQGGEGGRVMSGRVVDYALQCSELNDG